MSEFDYETDAERVQRRRDEKLQAMDIDLRNLVDENENLKRLISKAVYHAENAKTNSAVAAFFPSLD